MRIPFVSKSNWKKAIGFTLLGWLSLSTMYLLSKLIQGKTTLPTMLLFRSLPGFFLVLPWIVRHAPKSFQVNKKALVFSRALLGLINVFFIFIAVSKISIVNTTLLNNSAPFFVPFLVYFVLKKPVNSRVWPAILFGFIGIALVLKPDARIFNVGALYGLLSGICMAILILTMRLTTKTESLPTLMFYFFSTGIVITLPFAIADWKVADDATLLALIGIGLASAFAQALLFCGLKYGKAHQLAPLAYTTVFFSGLYEWLIWGITPTMLAYIGAFLIILSGGWIVWIGRKPKES